MRMMGGLNLFDTAPAGPPGWQPAGDGTMLLSTEGTDLVRCVVVALPLGVTRLGRQEPGGCLPDPRS